MAFCSSMCCKFGVLVFLGVLVGMLAYYLIMIYNWNNTSGNPERLECYHCYAANNWLIKNPDAERFPFEENCWTDPRNTITCEEGQYCATKYEYELTQKSTRVERFCYKGGHAGTDIETQFEIYNAISTCGIKRCNNEHRKKEFPDYDL